MTSIDLSMYLMCVFNDIICVWLWEYMSIEWYLINGEILKQGIKVNIKRDAFWKRLRFWKRFAILNKGCSFVIKVVICSRVTILKRVGF